MLILVTAASPPINISESLLPSCASTLNMRNVLVYARMYVQILEGSEQASIKMKYKIYTLTIVNGP